MNAATRAVARLTSRSKYGARKVKADGHTFDSAAEYRRYLMLRDDERRGKISRLQVHPRFELWQPFTDRWGRKHAAICYEADFRFTTAGRDTVEDVKGVKTAVYQLKKKLFLALYKELDFHEVEARKC